MRTKSESPNRVAAQFGDPSLICSEDCGYSNPMLAISVDTVIKWLLGELIFLIYTFIFRKKLISVLIWFHSYKDS